MPAETGRPAVYSFGRYKVRIDIVTDAAAWGSGWDFDGMKPVDVGDLIAMAVLAGEARGRRAALYELLENVAVADVEAWLKGVRALKFADDLPADPIASAPRKRATRTVSGRKSASGKAAAPSG